MSAPALPIEPASDTALPYTNYRVALATAILGSLGATSAWIVLLAIETGDWHLIITITVGAVVGLAAHWVQHYIRVARRERNEESTGHGAERHQSGHPLAALLWAGGFAFVGLATEHLIAHMVTEFLRPFLASFASLLPAGAILGWTMSRGRPKDENLIQLIATGFFIGATIAVVTGIIWTLGFGTAPWTALVSWWGLIGIGTRAMTRPERNAVRVGDPIAAVALVFALTFLLNLLPVTYSSYDKLGPFKSVALIVRSTAAGIQQSPAVPAKFWNEAEHKLAVDGGELDSAPITKPRSMAHATDTSALHGAMHIDLKGAVDSLTAPPPSDNIASRWSSLTGAFSWELFRSWFVIVFFALGAGLAPQAEWLLRPIDYPNSQTYRNDMELTIFMALLLVVACLVGRFGTVAHGDLAHPVARERRVRTLGLPH
jgi:hypothetical protein